MTSFTEAVEIVLENVRSLPAEALPLADCLGLVAAQDVRSPLSLPAWANSGPDGYALHAADVAGASREHPVVLRIGETVRAGAPPKQKVARGTAARVMTGSVFPQGADCVVRFEETDEPSNKCGPNCNHPTEVKIFTSARPGEGVMLPGTMVKRGDRVMAAGTVIGPAQISAMSSLGLTQLKVYRRPVVAIVATGDELIAAGKPLTLGKNYNANAPALVAAVRHLGAIPKLIGIARDNLASVEKQMAKALQADVIITSGGVSKGDFDLTRVVLGKLGQVLFNRIQMRPGAACTFGIIARGKGKKKQVVPVFALPGPPAGCLICFEAFVHPALRKMMGRDEQHRRAVAAHCDQPVENSGDYSMLRWSELTHDGDHGYHADFHSVYGGIGAGSVAQMAHSNAVTILTPGAQYASGEHFEVLPLDWVD